MRKHLHACTVGRGAVLLLLALAPLQQRAARREAKEGCRAFLVGCSGLLAAPASPAGAPRQCEPCCQQMSYPPALSLKSISLCTARPQDYSTKAIIQLPPSEAWSIAFAPPAANAEGQLQVGHALRCIGVGAAGLCAAGGGPAHPPCAAGSRKVYCTLEELGRVSMRTHRILWHFPVGK